MKFAIFGNKHQTKKSQSIGILFDAITKRGDTYAIDKAYYDFLCQEHIAPAEPQEIFKDNDFTADIAISFGGDGTLLRTASRVGNKAIPVLGINAGRLGFLTASSNEDIDDIIENEENLEPVKRGRGRPKKVEGQKPTRKKVVKKSTKQVSISQTVLYAKKCTAMTFLYFSEYSNCINVYSMGF